MAVPAWSIFHLQRLVLIVGPALEILALAQTADAFSQNVSRNVFGRLRASLRTSSRCMNQSRSSFPVALNSAAENELLLDAPQSLADRFENEAEIRDGCG